MAAALRLARLHRDVLAPVAVIGPRAVALGLGGIAAAGLQGIQRHFQGERASSVTAPSYPSPPLRSRRAMVT